MSGVGGDFPQYIVEFQLFENMPPEHLFHISEHIAMYDMQAFGDQAALVMQIAEATGGMPR